MRPMIRPTIGGSNCLTPPAPSSYGGPTASTISSSCWGTMIARSFLEKVRRSSFTLPGRAPPKGASQWNGEIWSVFSLLRRRAIASSSTLSRKLLARTEPWTEKCGPDPDVGCAQPHSRLEIIAHAHGELGEAISTSNLGEKREMRRGGFANWRNAHETGDYQAMIATRPGEKDVDLMGRQSALLGLLSGVDLHQQLRAATRTLDFPGDLLGQPHPIQGLDRVEEADREPHLVGLERAYQTQLQARAPAAPPIDCFLDPVFTEDALPARDNGGDRLAALLLGDGGQSDVRGIPPSLSGRPADARQDGVAGGGWIECRVRH